MKHSTSIDGVSRPESRVTHSTTARPTLVHTTGSVGLDGLSGQSSARTSEKKLAKATRTQSVRLFDILIKSFLVLSSDKPIRSQALVWVLCNWRLYILVSLPLFFSITRATPDGIIATVKAHHTGSLVVSALSILIIMWIVFVLGGLLLYTLSCLLYNTRFKQLDHRTKSHASQFKLVLNNWPTHLGSFGLACLVYALVGMVVGMLAWVILTSTSVFVAGFAPMLLYALLILAIVLIAGIWSWRRMSVLNASVTTEPFGANVYYTTILSTKNFLSLVGFWLYSVLVTAVYMLAIGLSVWLEATYIDGGVGITSKVLIVVLASLAIALLLWHRKVWSTKYWTWVDYRLVHDSMKNQASHYLTMLSPFRFLKTKLIFLIISVGLVLGVGIYGAYSLKPTIVHAVDKVSRAADGFDVTKLIPAKK